jgi:hypothetical protein
MSLGVGWQWIVRICHPHSFSHLRRNNVEGATIEKTHNQTNASMVSVALIEIDETMRVSSGPVEEQWEEKRRQLEAIDWEL